MIPKRFLRIWLGTKERPAIFDEWWEAFRVLHPEYEFVTLTDADEARFIPPELSDVYRDADTYAGRSDILRLLALRDLGGVYVDTDIMPLRSFDPILADAGERVFAGRRSRVSFESAVIGAPPEHPAILATLAALPSWYWAHAGRTAPVRTGPAFISSVLFGRPDVLHLPPKTFYPFNGFRAPKRVDKGILFSRILKDPPSGMYSAHFSNHSWGGKPKDAR